MTASLTVACKCWCYKLKKKITADAFETVNACILVINVFKNGASEQLRTAYLSSSVGHRLVTVWEGFFFWYCNTLSSLCAHTLLVRDLPVMLHGLSGTLCLPSVHTPSWLEICLLCCMVCLEHFVFPLCTHPLG